MENKIKGMNKKKEKPKSKYQETESLLYDYGFYKRLIKQKEIAIQKIKNNEITFKKSTSEAIVQCSPVFLSELEKQENKIEKLQSEIRLIKISLDLLETMLEVIRNDKYYKVIELKYFEKKSIEDIAEIMDKSPITISRARKRLINELVKSLFTEEVMKATKTP